jgi:hypothetical protein
LKILNWFSFLILWPLLANGGPVFDPFLEEFQVGGFLDHKKVEMVGIWPGGLLTPVQADTVWLNAAYRILSGPDRHPGALTHRFLAALPPQPWGSTENMALQVAQVRNPPETTAAFAFENGFLLPERWSRTISALVAKGRPRQARDLLARGLENPKLQLRDREAFVWRLRLGYLDQLLGEPARPLNRPWPAETRMGPYDLSCVWALWALHRRAAGQPVLPATMGSDKAEATRLAGLRNPGITQSELAGSSFSKDFKAGLGATWFEGQDLEEHLDRYPTPPADLSAQGWWVKGMRFLKRGDTGHYSRLAGREDLLGDWRLDVWRRTSEIHLLAGRWTKGLEALDQALALARAGEGTPGLRRRLRQWVEQAAVLALAQDKKETARQLLADGDRTFPGEEGRAFRKETANWRSGGISAPGATSDPVDRFRELVTTGEIQDARPFSGTQHQRKLALLRTADRELWTLWFRWGRSLAQVDGLDPEVARRAQEYLDLLPGLENALVPEMEAAALKAIGHRLNGRNEILEPFLRKLVDRDVGLATGWQSAPEPSPVPALLPVLRKSQLDMHAALGLALFSGDMRGILGIAFELPAGSLTRLEKRLFLYPLPSEGPIRQALLAADSDPALILAVARNESLFEPAVRSRAGALGYMQIMPFHFEKRGAVPGPRHWGIPAISIGKGDRLLEDARRRYQGDPYRQLAAYNAGPKATDRWNRQLGGVPDRDLFLAWIGYTETRNYVEKVLIDREIYDWFLRGMPRD